MQKISSYSSRDIFFQQISAVQQYQQQVQEARFLFESSMKMLGGGIIVGDVFGKVVFLNQQAEILLGDSERGYLAMLNDIELSNSGSAWSEILEGVLCEQTRVEQEGRVGVHDVSVSLELINVPNTHVHLLLVHLAEITRVKNAQRARNEMIDFLSHDMRSPMTSLKAMLDQVRDGYQQLDQDLWLEQAQEKVNKSLHYTEQLLYLAKVESEDEIQMYEVDLYSVAQNALDSVFYPAKQRGIELTSDIDDDCWVWGNGDLLERVLTNLLSNAIKYGLPNKPVDLRISSQSDCVTVRVRNLGPAIDEQLQQRLFQPFQRAKYSNQKGIGLGLRFVDVALRRHHATPQVHSDEHYTEFRFELPLITLAD